MMSKVCGKDDQIEDEFAVVNHLVTFLPRALTSFVVQMKRISENHMIAMIILFLRWSNFTKLSVK